MTGVNCCPRARCPGSSSLPVYGLHDGRPVTAISASRGAPDRVTRIWDGDPDGPSPPPGPYPDTESPTCPQWLSPAVVHGDAALRSRFHYRPPAQAFEMLREEAERGTCLKEKLGLAGAAVSDIGTWGSCAGSSRPGGERFPCQRYHDAVDKDCWTNQCRGAQDRGPCAGGRFPAARDR